MHSHLKNQCFFKARYHNLILKLIVLRLEHRFLVSKVKEIPLTFMHQREHECFVICWCTGIRSASVTLTQSYLSNQWKSETIIWYDMICLLQVSERECSLNFLLSASNEMARAILCSYYPWNNHIKVNNKPVIQRKK